MEKQIIRITEEEDVTYELISEIIYKFFTFDGKSILKGSDNRISKNERVWFINFAPIRKISELIEKEKYAIYPSVDLEEIFLFNDTGSKKLVEARFEKLKSSDDSIIVFAKFKDNFKYEGYKFLGVYKFEGMVENNLNNLVFKKVKNTYIFSKQK
ncbi:hypothetical protein [Spiroplasma sp. BIUS-1]|uniref:hypothetical protein n=1 Tax=Spiroplasma sp. BIUS-1 TaxID=216964 RepID=UPI0013978118|nr:hypothetical protein [Spiroplasma sp. BIUS-1]QHX37087.1 hypothetical protein SBIUS_v1c08340 [Spiroplasma sp. BIUS-1]